MLVPPGADFGVLVYPSLPNVGGCDVWVSSYYDENDSQWFQGWHTPKSTTQWFLTPHVAYDFIGWEKYSFHGDVPHLMESWYVYPNPSKHPTYEFLRLRSCLPWFVSRVVFDDQGDPYFQELFREGATHQMLEGDNNKGDFLKGHSKGAGHPANCGTSLRDIPRPSSGKGKGCPKGLKGSYWKGKNWKGGSYSKGK